MTFKTYGKVILASVLLAACGGTQETARDTQPSAGTTNPLSEQLVMSTLWFQTSVEAKQIFEQTYDLAYDRLMENMEQKGSDREPAIILDLDETVLDNSPYEARLVREGRSFSPESWAEWVSAANADVLPGAKEFLEKAQEAGVQIYYISNRSEEQLVPTLDNLHALDLPFAEEEFVLLKSNTSDKTERREQVKELHEVVLLIGDQMTDFAEEYEPYQVEPELRDSLDQYFVLLPNPMYGGFESRVYKDYGDADDAQKAEMRKKALETKE